MLAIIEITKTTKLLLHVNLSIPDCIHWPCFQIESLKGGKWRIKHLGKSESHFSMIKGNIGKYRVTRVTLTRANENRLLLANRIDFPCAFQFRTQIHLPASRYVLQWLWFRALLWILLRVSPRQNSLFSYSSSLSRFLYRLQYLQHGVRIRSGRRRVGDRRGLEPAVSTKMSMRKHTQCLKRSESS